MSMAVMEREQQLDERMERFKAAIRKWETEEIRKVKQKSADEVEFETGKIMSDAREKESDAFSKRVKGVEVEAKIRKSRKVNELRLSKMKVRSEMIEKIQSDVKSALLTQVSDAAKYRGLLEGLLLQGMIKMLEESIEVRCLKRDEGLVRQAIAAAEHRFRDMCVLSSKLQVARQSLPQSELGGVVLTSLNGRIVCNNTLRARLEYALQLSLPDVRAILFPIHQEQQEEQMI